MVTRQPDVDGQQFHDAVRDAMSCSATTTFVIETSQRPFRIDSIELISDAGVASDATDYYTLAIEVGGRVVGTWSLLTGADGAITAATPANVVLAAESGQNRVAAAGELVSLVATKHASGANLVNLRCVVHGRYVG